MYVLVNYLRIKRKGVFLLEKVEVLDNFDQGMSTAVVSTNQLSRKMSEKISCELLFTPFTERLKGPCVCVAGRWRCRL
jgi:hypothetical protein